MLSATEVLKSSSKRAIRKTAEATDGLMICWSKLRKENYWLFKINIIIHNKVIWKNNKRIRSYNESTT